MAVDSMQRRSTTRAIPRKRYTVDPFEGIDELQDVDSDDDKAATSTDGDGSGEDFQDAADDAVEEDDLSGLDEDEQENFSQYGKNAGNSLLQIMSDVEGLSDTDTYSQRPGAKSHKSKRKKSDQARGLSTFTRGLPDSTGKVSQYAKETRWLLFLGPAPCDVDPVLQAKSKWSHQPTLPARKADSDGFGGFHPSFYISNANRAGDGKAHAKRVFGDQVQQFMDEKHTSEIIGSRQAQDYCLSMTQHPKCDVMVGPFKKQRMYRLVPYDQIRLTDVWQSSPSKGSAHGYKNGFLINIGHRIQCLDWVPNQTGTHQYIAVSTLPRRKSWLDDFESSKVSSFLPQEPYKSSIQIWELQAKADGNLDLGASPRQVLGICTNWGAARRLKWSPAPCEPSDTSDGHSLGLLAGIWTDGAIRVLQITLPLRSKQEISHVLIKDAAFFAQPPNTVFTSLTWIDGKRIAAGCANGCIAVWDLEVSFRSDLKNARPMIYTSVSSSFILEIVSCSPSRPDILVVSTMAGFVIEIDTSKPGQPALSSTNCAPSSRLRVIQPTLFWHDFAQAILYVDDSFVLRGSSIRRIFTTTALGRYRSQVMCTATSPVHPYVLAGTAGGEVISSNPIRRYLDGKSPVFQQTWFAHEWRRPTEKEKAVDVCEQDPPSIGSNGLSRMLEGQKVERVTLTLDTRKSGTRANGGSSGTICEEKSAVTALAWNPNIHVAGWAAASCGDGLLRLEDLAM